MFSRFSKTILCFILITAFLLPIINGFAQENLEEICQWEKIEEKPENLSDKDYESLLKKCQPYYEEKVEEIEKDITKTQQEKDTLKNKIYILENKIKSLDYQIYQGNIIIKDLGAQIQDTQLSIDETNLKIEEVKRNLSNVLQLQYEEDQRSSITILLAEETLTGLFDELMALEAINLKTQDLLKNIKNLKFNLEGQKKSMDEEKGDLENVVMIQTLQKQESAKTKEQQEYFWKLTEEEYQKQLKEKEETAKKAAEIRAKIYELIGIRKEVTYEEALEVAKYAASQLGIRPALLLGVLSQESAIGKNVGQCYVKNTSTGSGVVAYSGKAINNVMNPTRDIPHFLNIIKKLNSDKGLNLDPFETLVSCPMSFGGVGGAMGPAQFIPSTWVLYEDRVKERTGNSADPWDLRDASLAASTYLKDGINKYGTEGKAVQAYFCGSPKNTYWCSWYEKNVLYLADCHQNFITSGSMSLKCQEAIGLK